MKRTRLKRVSKKQRANEDASRETREALLFKHSKCMICGHDPSRTKFGNIAWVLDCHEIANGPNRCKARGKPFATLIVCRLCHEEELSSAEKWPEAKQLALLKILAPEDYDLAAYNALVNPRAPQRITEEEVATWCRFLLAAWNERTAG